MNYDLAISVVKTKQMEAYLPEIDRETAANVLAEFASQPALAIPSSNQRTGGLPK